MAQDADQFGPSFKTRLMGCPMDNVKNIYKVDEIVTRLRAAGCVFAEEEADLLVDSAVPPSELADMVGRRVAGLPLEQVLGWAAFCGLRIKVAPGVFVPRRRTEFLVEQAVAAAHPGAVVVDLCCGSGAVGAALASMVEPIELYAADIDPASVQCARFNIPEEIGRVSEGDLYKALPPELAGRIDVLVANTPYVPTTAIPFLPREAREHEPPGALDGGLDGLDVQRRIAAEARHWLARGGQLLVETSLDQSPRTAEIFTRSGLVATVVHSDELDATVVIGTLL